MPGKFYVYKVKYMSYNYGHEDYYTTYCIARNPRRAALIVALDDIGLEWYEARRFARYQPSAEYDEYVYDLDTVECLGQVAEEYESEGEGCCKKHEALRRLAEPPHTLKDYLDRYPEVGDTPLTEEFMQLLEGIRVATNL